MGEAVKLPNARALRPALRRLAEAALEINAYADHDDDCVLRTGAGCQCRYTNANLAVLDAAEAAITALGLLSAEPKDPAP